VITRFPRARGKSCKKCKKATKNVQKIEEKQVNWVQKEENMCVMGGKAAERAHIEEEKACKVVVVVEEASSQKGE
jgi:hypothetical protein